MTRFLQPLWLLLTTSNDSKLRQMIEYLRKENRILRSKLPTRVTLTAREKNRLLKLGAAVGGAIRELITIVSYRTFCRWRVDAALTTTKKRAAPVRTPGHPRTAAENRTGTCCGAESARRLELPGAHHPILGQRRPPRTSIKPCRARGFVVKEVFAQEDRFHSQTRTAGRQPPAFGTTPRFGPRSTPPGLLFREDTGFCTGRPAHEEMHGGRAAGAGTPG